MKRRQTLAVLGDSQQNHSLSQFGARTGGLCGQRAAGRPPSGTVPAASGHRASLPARRRSSVAPRQSLAASTPLVPLNSSVLPRDSKDPRPLRDKHFQLTCIRNIVGFLVHAGFPHPVTTKTLQTPTKKDFEAVFRFLYSKLDPHYVFTKKFEEEVPAILRGLRYPFADSISKSQLYAVGSMHSWPNILAMLTWLMELVVMCEQMEPGTGWGGDDGSNGMEGDMLFFDYLTKAYQCFLAGDDDFAIMETELAANFDRKNETVLKEIERFNLENQNLEAEIKSHTENEPPLVTLADQRKILESDNEKFQQYISKLQTKKSKLEDGSNKLKNELESFETSLNTLTIEKESLQAQIDAQDISPTDFDRMTNEREQLSEILAGLQSKEEEISKVMWEREIGVQKRLDQIEKLVQDYNTATYRLGLIPCETSLYAAGLNLELEFNLHANRPDQMVSVDLRNVIKPFLAKLRQKFNSQVHKSQDELILLNETLDKLSESLLDKVEELKSLEGRIAKANAVYNEEKESYSRETDMNNAQMENLEQELQKMRTECTTGLLASQQKAQKITIEYDNLLRRAHEQKERAGKELIRILEDLIAFKTHIEGSLADVERLSMEEYDNEVGNQSTGNAKVEFGVGTNEKCES